MKLSLFKTEGEKKKITKKQKVSKKAHLEAKMLSCFGDTFKIHVGLLDREGR